MTLTFRRTSQKIKIIQLKNIVAMQKWYQNQENGWGMRCISKLNKDKNQLAMSNMHIIPSKPVTD